MLTYLAHEKALLSWKMMLCNFLEVVHNIANHTMKVWDQPQRSIRATVALILNRRNCDPFVDEAKEVVSFQKGHVISKPMAKEENSFGVSTFWL